MSLLSSLRGLVRSEEDLATAALAHVLSTHGGVAEEFNRLLGIPSGVVWSTQENFDDGEGSRGRPDLVARMGGAPRAFVEAKFLAGLTSAQPNHYLRMLDADGVLVFLVPETRLAYLEGEVLRRANEISSHLEPSQSDDEALRSSRTHLLEGGARQIIFVTWSGLVRVLVESATRSGADRARLDLEQIESLIRDIEGEAFVPFTSDQLTSGEIPRVSLQVRDLLRGTRDGLLARGYTKVGNFTTNSHGWTGASVSFSGLQWSVFESWKSWQRFGHSPIWLTLGEEDRRSQGVLLERWFEDPRLGAVRLQHWTIPTVAAPILIPPDVDRQEVLDSMINQVCQLVERVAPRHDELSGSSAQ